MLTILIDQNGHLDTNSSGNHKSPTAIWSEFLTRCAGLKSKHAYNNAENICSWKRYCPKILLQKDSKLHVFGKDQELFPCYNSLLFHSNWGFCFIGVLYGFWRSSILKVKQSFEIQSSEFWWIIDAAQWLGSKVSTKKLSPEWDWFHLQSHPLLV